MKERLVFLALLIAILGVAVSGTMQSFLIASSNSDNNDGAAAPQEGAAYPEPGGEEKGAVPLEDNPEKEAENAAKEGKTEVYDDNPDLDKDGIVTDEENQKFTDAAVALGDKLNNPDQEPEGNDEDYTVTCWNGEEVAELSDCPEDDGSVTCPDGVTEAIQLSDCPSNKVPFPEPDESKSKDNKKPLPYCDLIDFSEVCFDRKDYDQGTGLYLCNDRVTYKTDWRDCKDSSDYDYGNSKDKGKDKDDESPQSTTAQLAITEPDPNRFSPIGGGVYFPTESIPNPDRLKFGPFGILLPNQADEEFGPSATTFTAEESSCKIVGSADGILQKFDASKYQTCGLYMNGQKVYSDAFVAGCTQVGNTQLICQAFIDSSILNSKIPAIHTLTQPAMQPTKGIQPAAVNE